MMLIEDVPVEDADLPLALFKDHLRLGTGFHNDTLQDSVLTGFLRASLSAIEGRTAKALFQREFTLTLNSWRGVTAEVLPLAPVVAVNEVSMADSNGDVSVLDPTEYRLLSDQSLPALQSTTSYLPSIPTRGTARIRFTAGFADVWGHLPSDLAQAVMLLAAHYYEYRDETALGHGCMPFGVTSLIQRYRPMRLSNGAPL